MPPPLPFHACSGYRDHDNDGVQRNMLPIQDGRLLVFPGHSISAALHLSDVKRLPAGCIVLMHHRGQHHYWLIAPTPLNAVRHDNQTDKLSLQWTMERRLFL